MAKKFKNNNFGEYRDFFCSSDDGDSAFWDEFFGREGSVDGQSFTITIVDDQTGEKWQYRNVNLGKSVKIE